MTRRLSLDGPWLLSIDPLNCGKSDGWEQRPQQHARIATVPGVIEETYPGYDGVAWFWLEFTVPQPPDGTGWSDLQFRAADYLTEAWLDGEYLGGHEGGETPFTLRLGSAPAPGRQHLLAVRLVHVGVAPIDGLELRYVPHGIKAVPFMPGRFHNFGRIWQSVDLLARPSVFMVDAFVQADRSTNQVTVTLTLCNRTGRTVQSSLELAISQCPGDGPLARQLTAATLSPGETQLDLTLAVDNALPWTLDCPTLYVAQSRLEIAGVLIDQHQVRFGFREFTFHDGYFQLNGQRLILKGTHTVGNYAMGLAVPRGPEQLRRELLNLKLKGINCCRSLGRMMFPEQLDFCDEIGLLVYEESLASWLWQSSPGMARRFDTSVREMILRDRNHPCVESAYGIATALSRAVFPSKGSPCRPSPARASSLAYR